MLGGSLPGCWVTVIWWVDAARGRLAQGCPNRGWLWRGASPPDGPLTCTNLVGRVRECWSSSATTAPLPYGQGPQGVRRYGAGDQVLGASHHGGRPGRVQPAAGGCLLPVGVRRTTASPGARRCDDAHRARGASHHQARGRSGTGWSASCTAAWPARPSTRSSWPGRGRTGCGLSTGVAVPGRGARPPACRLPVRPGAGGQRCREVKRDGTAAYLDRAWLGCHAGWSGMPRPGEVHLRLPLRVRARDQAVAAVQVSQRQRRSVRCSD
jgi:hypothetical protein